MIHVRRWILPVPHLFLHRSANPAAILKQANNLNSKQGRFQAAAANGDNTLSLQAYLTDRQTDVVVRANAVEREWISTETGGNGYRCIPLNMASSLGWSS